MRTYVVKYITADDCPLYDLLGWKITFYGTRSCIGPCFIASFLCRK